MRRHFLFFLWPDDRNLQRGIVPRQANNPHLLLNEDPLFWIPIQTSDEADSRPAHFQTFSCRCNDKY